MPRLAPWFVGLMLLIVVLAINSWRMQRQGHSTFDFKAMNRDMMASGGAMAPEAAGFAGGEMARDESMAYATSDAPMAPPMVEAQLASNGGVPNPLDRMQQSEADRFLIRNGSLNLEVKDPSAVAKQVEALAAQKQGYTGELHESVDYLERKNITMTVRVPADEFEATMSAFEAFGKPLDKHITSEDVTEEFLDVQQRIKNLKDTEARLLAHLAESKRLTDTLEVEREITRVRGELEAYEGRLKYLSHRISFSTITLTLQEEAGPEPVTPANKWSAQQEFTAAVRDLVVFGQGILAQGIWLAVWAIVWLPILLLVRWAWGRLTRARRARAAALDSAV